MIKITIDDREVQKLIKDLTNCLKDRRPLMRKIAGIMHDAVEKNFEAEGRPGWKPSKRAIIQGGKTLQDTGSLATSISQTYDNDKAIVGTNKIYAAIHQFGFHGSVSVKSHIRKIKSRDIRQGKKIIAKGITTVKEHSKTMNIPQRPFLKLTEEDLETIKMAIIEHLKPR